MAFVIRSRKAAAFCVALQQRGGVADGTAVGEIAAMLEFDGRIVREVVEAALEKGWVAPTAGGGVRLLGAGMIVASRPGDCGRPAPKAKETGASSEGRAIRQEVSPGA